MVALRMGLVGVKVEGSEGGRVCRGAKRWGQSQWRRELCQWSVNQKGWSRIHSSFQVREGKDTCRCREDLEELYKYYWISPIMLFILDNKKRERKGRK